MYLCKGYFYMYFIFLSYGLMSLIFGDELSYFDIVILYYIGDMCGILIIVEFECNYIPSLILCFTGKIMFLH